ncbi:hypothetical protein JCM10207_000138 [Rhodosporidiobolus poonsookiae]
MSDSSARPTALVTGAASGIALALVRSFLSGAPGLSASASAEPAYNVLLVDLSPNLSSVAAQLADKFGADRVEHVKADVTRYDELAVAFERAKKREGWNGRVNVVCAIAGISQVFSTPDGRDPFFTSARLSPDGSAPAAPNLKVIDVNLNGVLNTVHLAVAYFRAQPLDERTQTRGRIVCAGSLASLYPFPNESLYGAAKHGVLGAVRSLAVTLAPEGININAIAPSLVDTNIGNAEAFTAIKKMGLATPMEQVVKAVRILTAGEAPATTLTGQILEICLSHLFLRAPPRIPHADEHRCMDVCHPVAELDRTVGAWRDEGVRRWLEGVGVTVVGEGEGA